MLHGSKSIIKHKVGLLNLAEELEMAVLDHITRRLFTKTRLKKLLAGVYKQLGRAGKRADASVIG
jgi:hypothetical protein